MPLLGLNFGFWKIFRVRNSPKPGSRHSYAHMSTSGPVPSVHPFLLQPEYWRTRLERPGASQGSLLLLPRPDISTPFVEVEEFRFRAHDDLRLWGVRMLAGYTTPGHPTKICLAGPAEAISPDTRALEPGGAFFFLREPPGRRLEDQVLDVLRLACLIASLERRGVEHIDCCADEQRAEPNHLALRIAEELKQTILV